MIWVYFAFFAVAVAKWTGIVDTFANVSWSWILLPLLAIVLWFEVFERVFGFDSRRQLEEASFEKAKKERLRKQLERPGVRR